MERSVTEYPVSVTVAGNTLDKYNIVYSNSKDLEALEAFRDKIAKNSGYVMDIVLDTQTEPSKYEILFGETNRAESSMIETPDSLNYTIRVVDEKLVIKAGGAHSAAKLLEELYDVLTEGSDDVKIGSSYAIDNNYYDDPHNTAMHKDADIRIMSANVMAHRQGYEGPAWGFDLNRRAEIFMAALDFYQPTVAGVVEFCKAWYDAIESYNRLDKWGLLRFPNPILEGESAYSTIMYRKDLLTLIDSGTKFYDRRNNNRVCGYTWAVFEIKETGKRFCFASTHWTMGRVSEEQHEIAMTQVAEIAEFVKEMNKQYPVYTCGDFNAHEREIEFMTYLESADIVDAMYAAEKRLNIAASWHGWGGSPGMNSIDHITATKDSTVLTFETLIYNEQIWASDHSWLIADIKFND